MRVLGIVLTFALLALQAPPTQSAAPAEIPRDKLPKSLRVPLFIQAEQVLIRAFRTCVAAGNQQCTNHVLGLMENRRKATDQCHAMIKEFGEHQAGVCLKLLEDLDTKIIQDMGLKTR